MGGKSKIEWTEQTWNPIVGCSIVSPGCTNCYAMKMASRIEAMGNQPRYAGTTRKVKGNAIWTGKLARAPDSILLAPLKRKKPTTYFVNSMGDLFHEDCPDEWIDRVFAVMALCPQHTFQVLTKRAKRMREYLSTSGVVDKIVSAIRVVEAEAAARSAAANSRRKVMGPDDIISADAYAVAFNLEGGYAQWPLPNVWLGVSTERQREADERIPLLLQTPAAVRFISAEPLLGRIDISDYLVETVRMNWPSYLNWVIAGGESGPKARPLHTYWPRTLRDQCAASPDVAFFFKQWGEYLPVGQSLPDYGKVHGATAVKPGRMKLHYAGTPKQAPKHAFAERGVEFASTTDGRLTFRVGKKAAGRLLDGVEHNGMPEIKSKQPKVSDAL